MNHTFLNCDDGGLINFCEIKSIMKSGKTIVVFLKSNRKSVILTRHNTGGYDFINELKKRVVTF